MIRYWFLLVIILGISACQEVEELELRNTTPKLVVDGLITNQPGPYYVKLSTSGSFYDQGPTPKVTDAKVTLSDDAGNSEVLTYISEEPGTYKSTQMQGEVGRTYYLTIEYRGQTYQAQSYLPYVTKIDKIEVQFIKGTVLRDEGYYLYFYAKEPRGEKNYYRWMIYKNDSLYNKPSDLLIASDDMVKGDIEGLELGYTFQKGDTVRLEMHSLTKEGYDYYLGLQNVYFNDGGLFSPPPVNPPSTISNGALGIFRAAGVEAATVIIE